MVKHQKNGVRLLITKGEGQIKTFFKEIKTEKVYNYNISTEKNNNSEEGKVIPRERSEKERKNIKK